MLISAVNSVAADGLAPEGAGPSAGTVMTKLGSHNGTTGPEFDGLFYQGRSTLSLSL